MTYADFIELANLSMECVAGGICPDDFKNSDPWVCTLKMGEATYQTPFYTGKGHRKLDRKFTEHETHQIMAGITVWAREMQRMHLKVVAPTLETVLDCLASDADGYDNSHDFEDWATNYGYDPDSRRGEKLYHVVAEQAKKLRNLLGSELYTKLLCEVERL